MSARGEIPDIATKLRWRAQSAFAVNQAREAVETLWSCYGAQGLYTRDPLQRHLRDVIAMNQHFSFNFDIAGAGDDLVGEYNDPPLPGHDGNWHRLTHEIRRKRSSSHKRRWRVRNQTTGAGYELLPGVEDGAADSFGIGDFWAMRYRSTQLDDSAVATRSVT